MESFRRSSRLKNKLNLASKQSIQPPRKNKTTSKKRLREEKDVDIRVSLNSSLEDADMNDYGTLTSITDKVNKDDIDWSQNLWICATATKNYVLDDGFLDVLENNSTSVTRVKKDYQNSFIKTIGNPNPKSFTSMLMTQGVKFENNISELIIGRIGAKNNINIGGNFNPRSKEKVQATIKAMKKGIPVIQQPCLRNYDNMTYGVPDLIVRSDYLDKLVDTNDTKQKPLTKEELRVQAPGIVSKSRKKRKGKIVKKKSFHYVIVDIKFKTLYLTSDGLHLRNDGHMKAYKSQLLIYNEALGKMQGYTPPHSFILGRKWKYVSSKVTHSGTSCFDCLGKIDYEGRDEIYIEKNKEAIEWIRTIRKEGDKWDLTTTPLPRPELYPNMSNNYDFPYHKLKKEFADNISEITSVYKCGPKQRRIAHSNGVYKWTDEKCTAKTLGITSEYTAGIVNAILKANQTDSQDPLDYIYPRYIKNNFNNWKEEQPLEFFVDFEMTCSVFGDLKDLPEAKGESIIFLIGAGHIDPKSRKWIFKYFVTKEIDSYNESVICKQFINYVARMAKKYSVDVDDVPLYHWSHAERTTWNKAMSRHGIFNGNVFWSDLLKVFYNEPIAVKGSLKYSLKNIARAFHDHEFINTIWDDGSSCADGADAAVGAYRIYKECKRLDTSFPNNPYTKEIIRYNEVDCKVVQEILFYLRDNHVNYDEDEEDSSSEDSSVDDDMIISESDSSSVDSFEYIFQDLDSVDDDDDDDSSY